MSKSNRSEKNEKTWEEISKDVLGRIDPDVGGASAYPIPYEYRKHADSFLGDSRMGKAYHLMCAKAKDGQDIIGVFADALCLALMHNPDREKVPPSLADTKSVRRLLGAAKMLVQRLPAMQNSKGFGDRVLSKYSRSALWFHAVVAHARRSNDKYPIEEFEDGRVLDALQIVVDFLSFYIPEPRGKGRPVATDQNRLMLRLAGLFTKQFRRPCHAVIALFLEVVCGGGWTAKEVKTSLARLRKQNKA